MVLLTEDQVGPQASVKADSMNRLMKDLAIDHEWNAGAGLDNRWEDKDEEGEENEDEFEMMDHRFAVSFLLSI